MGAEQLPLPQFEVDTPFLDVVFVVILREREGEWGVLIAERKDGSGWSFPGGKKEPEEDWLCAARRELFEETGLQIDLDNDLWTKATIEDIRVLQARGNVRARGYMLFADEVLTGEPAQKEANKLGPWEWKRLSEIDSLVLQGELGVAYATAWWREFVESELSLPNEKEQAILERAAEVWFFPHGPRTVQDYERIPQTFLKKFA